MGMVSASANTSIRYYGNAIGTGNVITAANTTLSVSLMPGETHTVTQTLINLSPMPARFYVRIMDNGTNFPATGATAWQWFLNGTAISGATGATCNPASAGSYTVTYYNGTCVSQMSAAATVRPCLIPVNPHLRARVY
jgi:hypothetical protein